MKKIIIPIEIVIGMQAPKWYFRIFDFVVMWWGLNNGRIEFKYYKGATIQEYIK